MAENQPSTSSSAECEDQNLQGFGDTMSEESKQELANAIHVFSNLFRENGYALPTVSASISERSRLIGNELYRRFWIMHGEMTFAEVEEILWENESDAHPEFVEISNIVDDSSSSESTSSSCKSGRVDEDVMYEPEAKKCNTWEQIPLDVKITAVTLAKRHPKWSLRTLQTKGATIRLTRKDLLKRWEADVKSGGSRVDKFNAINKWTFDRFVEARERAEHVTTTTLRQWGMAASMQFQSNESDFQFTASSTWVRKFKANHKIRQRHVTKYVSNKEAASLEKLLEVAELFQRQARTMIAAYDRDFVINTDQTGCEYRVNIKRTLSHQGEKRTFVAVGSVNKVTHSYTAQYSITASGKLLPTVFLCMQEPNGKFGPRVSQEVEDLQMQFRNVYVTCSKSGKLTSQLYQAYLDNVLKPYVQQNKFCLILDSWGGQTDMTRYDETFVDDDAQPTCAVKVIPPKCTALCQPCDVYFFRQVKNFIARIQNHVISQRSRELHDRADAIKIHALIHNQLSAPVFQDMLIYAWFASKLTFDRPVFSNVNQICFPREIFRKNCQCGETSFVCCAWCENYLCFACLYNKFHPSCCKGVSKKIK